MAFYTEAGRKFGEASTKWLQDTRLMSEATYRLYSDYKKDGRISFSQFSWPKSAQSEPPLREFRINPVPLAKQMESLLKSLWRAQFVFLESIWEEYLQDLVLELRTHDASIFEPFCEQKFMASLVQDVLAGRLDSLEEIKDEAAARFAAGITRRPWREQWSQLSGLNVGLTREQEKERWYAHLDVYFEMRNCLIHRGGRVSSLLLQKDDYFRLNKITSLQIWPQNLDFYRGQFLCCVTFIEEKIKARFERRDVAQ
jgi:hypothetical protein